MTEATTLDAPLPADHLPGANNPPEPTPFEGFTAHISDLLAETGNFCDGDAIQTQEVADCVSRLLDSLRTAKKDADLARAEEKRPHDDAAKAVQAKWKPLLDRVDLATDTCKKALAPLLKAKQDEIDRKAKEAREAAEQAAKAAREAIQAAAMSSSLAEREAAEELATAAKMAETFATKAGNERAGGESGGRRITLRDNYVCTVTDETELLRHYWTANRPALVACATQLAQAEVRAGKRTLPGCTIENHPVAV